MSDAESIKSQSVESLTANAEGQPCVFVVGPLPPPVHGFSNVMLRMCERFRQCPARVTPFDRASASRSPGNSARRQLVGSIQLAFSYLGGLARSRPALVYIGLSGGLGQLLDAFYAGAARILGVPLWIHHHSFAYLDRPGLLSRIVLSMASPCRHIVLCECMGERLATAYRLRPAQVCVVSNAVFMSNDSTRLPMRAGTAPLQIGFLSNITEDKGVFVFVELVRRLSSLGIAIDARIAGPIQPGLEARFAQALAGVAGITYLGPLYGAEKQTYLGRLDVLAFPSLYPNEAEPLVVLEAMQAGCAIVATDRGCIPGMVSPAYGIAVAQERFLSEAVEYVGTLARDPVALAAAAKAARRAFAARAMAARDAIDSLLDELPRGP